MIEPKLSSTVALSRSSVPTLCFPFSGIYVQFNSLAKDPELDLYPEELRDAIDKVCVSWLDRTPDVARIVVQ